jgi:hypothetical protein
MAYQALATEMEVDSEKSEIQIDLDDVIRSLEEAAQQIEKLDWEHYGLAGHEA